jgi:hypothetical protein
MREVAEVERAKQAQKVCAEEHEPAHEEFVRTIEAGERCRCSPGSPTHSTPH